ncbi:MAG: hypothetical protein Kow0079_02860 [Vicingaceae bacterium]
MRNFEKYIYLVIALIIVSSVGCSRKKNSFTRRAYHNTTSRYNYYFNAREILNKSIQSIESSYKKDYSEILPLFIYGTEDQAKALYPDLDKVIEKSSTLIEYHSIYVKKQEHNKWVDDAYMLIGKARFYKQEYFGALDVFKYVAKAYKNTDSRYSAITWIARTHMQLEDYEKALTYLEMLEKESSKMPKEYASDYNALYTDYYIKTKKYDLAIEKLKEAIQTTRKKETRSHYFYILAQLYLKNNDYPEASKYFTEVIKLRPDYELLFNARISRALAYDVGSEDNESIKKMLKKMIKDRKNNEYLDQIYYALADIALKEKNEPLAIEYLKKSVASSVNNNKQKALSYMRLGDLYFSKPKYVEAQAYYDSTLMLLPQDHERYDAIYDKNASLSRLVENIKIVTYEDSLQMLVKNEAKRKKVISELIEKVKEQEEKAASLANEIENDYNQNTINNNTNNTTGKWYFYNPTVKSFGFNEFKSVWGSRKLEDNWRRKNKQQVLSFEEDDGLMNDSLSNKQDTIKENPLLTEEYYLNQLPFSDSALAISDYKIKKALYNMGNIYRESFMDYNSSIESFETLISRYDTTEYKLPSWYNLYRINLTIDNDEKANYYRNLILDKYPYSEYASIIKDPSYGVTTRENKRRVENYYSIVYDLYKNKKYTTVLIRCDKAKVLFTDNHIQDKFDFLRALAIGQTNSVDSFKLALEEVIAKHPDSEVKPQAEELLKLINNQSKKQENNDTPATIYTFNENEAHKFVIIIPNADKKLNIYKGDFSNFNAQYYKNNNYKVNSLFLNPLNQLITVDVFANKQEAMDYYESVKLNKDILSTLTAKGYQFFVISNSNYADFYKSKDISSYLKFFNEKYLTETN